MTRWPEAALGTASGHPRDGFGVGVTGDSAAWQDGQSWKSWSTAHSLCAVSMFHAGSNAFSGVPPCSRRRRSEIWKTPQLRLPLVLGST